MDHDDWLAERFETNRDRLRAVAYRMVGSPSARRPRHSRPRVAFAFTITDEKISAISLIADATRLGELDVTIIKG